VYLPTSLKIALISYRSVLPQCNEAFRLEVWGERASWTFISACHVSANGTYCQPWNVWVSSI